MTADPSYAEYVDARWPMLYRLAALLVGDDHATALTEEALVRAYLHWHDAQEAASTDAHVEGLLARTAVEDFDRDAEGPGLDGLSTRRRAVVVLSCFELLGDAEVARALQAKEPDVAAEKAGVLARLGLSEPEVTVALEHRAARVAVPAPSVEDLVGRATARRRRQRRRALRWPAVAALVAVAAVAVANLGATGHEQPAKPAPIPAALARLPDGGPPKVAFTDGLTLLLPGGPTILGGRPRGLLQAGDWVYVTYRSGVIDQFNARTLGSANLTRSSDGQVVADPSGRHVAWLESHAAGEPPWITVRTAAADPAPLQQVDHDPPSGAGPLTLNGLTGSGDVIVSRPAESRTWVWHAGIVPAPTRPAIEEVNGLGNGTVAQVTAEDLVVGHLVYFAVGDLREGTFFVEDELEARQADFSDPLDTRNLYVDHDGRFHVSQRAPYGRSRSRGDVRLRLPASVTQYDSVRWEDPNHVLLDVSDETLPGGALVRCDVRTGGCEIAAKFEGPHLLAR